MSLVAQSLLAAAVPMLTEELRTLNRRLETDARERLTIEHTLDSMSQASSSQHASLHATLETHEKQLDRIEDSIQ